MLKLLSSIFFSILLAAPSSQVDVETMKAVYLERFTRFVEWPETMDSDLFRVQVIGDKQLAQAFEKAFQEINIQGKSVLVYSTSDNYNRNFNPHVVYVTEKSNLSKVIKDVAGGPVLIVTDFKGGGLKGSMINIILKDKKLKFEINERAMSNSPLYVSYKLKEMATRIISTIE